MSGAPAAADPAETATRRWVEAVVIGLDLCPFAARPFHAGRVLYRVTQATDSDGLYRAFLTLLEDMYADDGSAWETALLVVDGALADFDDYLDLLEMLEAAVAAVGLEGDFQLASFHPDYRFDGVPADDPANWSNRSPLPMFHLIRQAGLTAALASFPDPEQIPVRNVARLRSLGTAAIKRLLG